MSFSHQCFGVFIAQAHSPLLSTIDWSTSQSSRIHSMVGSSCEFKRHFTKFVHHWNMFRTIHLHCHLCTHRKSRLLFRNHLWNQVSVDRNPDLLEGCLPTHNFLGCTTCSFWGLRPTSSLCFGLCRPWVTSRSAIFFVPRVETKIRGRIGVFVYFGRGFLMFLFMVLNTNIQTKSVQIMKNRLGPGHPGLDWASHCRAQQRFEGETRNCSSLCQEATGSWILWRGKFVIASQKTSEHDMMGWSECVSKPKFVCSSFYSFVWICECVYMCFVCFFDSFDLVDLFVPVSSRWTCLSFLPC